jgi:Holliday junction resolvasome RuvABC endonuclease subunit
MKQIILALDVSTTTTGYALMEKDENLLDYGEFTIPERGLSDIKYTTLITKEVFKLIKDHSATHLIIEDVYCGPNVSNFKTWCRVHGGVGMSWSVNHNEPVFMMATEARRRVGINGKATKVEIQLETSNWYNLVKPSVYKSYKEQLKELIDKKTSKEYSKNQFDHRIKKLSVLYQQETGVSEHKGDAIVLARACLNKLNEDK